MATSYTTNLGLALPVTGELAGQWGQTINDEITSLLDSAIAGTTTLSSDADVTLTDTDGAANQSRQAILLWTANGTVTRTITAPARTKTYVVINATAGSQSIKIVGAGPTTGVTIAAGDKALVAWNGSDFVRVGASAGGANTQVQYNSNGNLAGSANLTFDGTNLTANTLTPTNALGIAYGGTSATTKTEAFDALAPTTTKGDLIVSNGTDNVRLAVGTNDYILTADSTQATGVKWAALPASGVSQAKATIISMVFGF